MRRKKQSNNTDFSAADPGRFPTLADFVGRAEPDPLAKTDRFADYIDFTRAQGLYTYSRIVDSPNEPQVKVYDPATKTEQWMLMFSSNNYLGLASHPKVIEAAQKAAAQYGVGVGGSPMICGTTRLHRELELKLAEFEGFDDAIIFPSGYTANLGLISSLVRPGDFTFVDRLVHASVIDGCAFGNSKVLIFKHNDPLSLDTALERVDADAGKLVIVEGVYSMDGDIPPIPAIRAVADRHNARLVIDDAHATGVIGPRGHGSVDHWGESQRPDVVIGTLSKALGSMGGFVAAESEVVTYLRAYGRSQFFSAGMTTPQVAAVLASLELIETEPWRVAKLADNSNYLRHQLRSRGIIPIGEGTPIVPVMIGEELNALKVGKRLHENGAFATPILYPAVPKGRARIRLSVMATHERAHIDYLVEALDNACHEFSVPRYPFGEHQAA